MSECECLVKFNILTENFVYINFKLDAVEQINSYILISFKINNQLFRYEVTLGDNYDEGDVLQLQFYRDGVLCWGHNFFVCEDIFETVDDDYLFTSGRIQYNIVPHLSTAYVDSCCEE